MKLWFHLALALLTFAGVLNSVSANPGTFNFENGCAAAWATDPIFDESGCEGIAAHFAANPIPVGAIDVETGKEIIGWTIHCPVVAVAAGGTQAGTGASRVIFRNYGSIRVKYAP